MLELKISCRTITPLFMYGARQNIPEIRSSSIKGMMRWWWRAMLAEDNIPNLKKQEAVIFGGTGEKEGKSKFRISILAKEFYDRYQGNNIFSKSAGGELSGLKYLFYSIPLRHNEIGALKPIQPKYSFDLEISAQEEKYLKIAVASLWLAIYLGGFGTRGRRGAGNLEITQVIGNSEVELIPQANSTTELKNFIKKNIDKIKSIIPQSHQGTKKYTTLKPAKVYIFAPKKDWQEALNFLGEDFRSFRYKNRSRIFDTAAFGMPIMHRSSGVRISPFQDGKKLSERWASPLIFKIVCSKGQYFPMLVRLNPGGVEQVGQLRRNNTQEKFLNQKNEFRNFSSKIIDEFLQSFTEKFEVLEL